MEIDEACKMDRQNKKCLLKDAIEGMVNGKKVRGRRRYQMINDIMKNGLYEDTKRKAEFALKDLPLGRTL